MKNMQVIKFRKVLRKFERFVSEQNKKNIRCCEVSVAQCHALLEIEEKGKTTIGDLSESMGLDKSTLSRTIDSLVKTEQVERRENPDDRRFSYITLSQKGCVTVNRINRENNLFFTKVFDGKSSDECNNIIGVFEDLTKSLLNCKGLLDE